MSVPLLNKLSNKPQRNGFDLSHRSLFTSDAGMLKPVFVEDVLPGDHFKINVNALTRTEQLNTAAFARINEHYDFFFVPYRLLWRFFPDWLVENQKLFFNYRNSSGSIRSDLPMNLPRINLTDIAGAFVDGSSHSYYDRYDELGYPLINGMHTLFDMLGYGRLATPYEVNATSGNDVGSVSITPLYVSPFRLLAYQKIYQDFYRNYLWENPDPLRCNIDYVDDSFANGLIPFDNFYDNIRQMCTIRYANYKKDYLLGVYPNTQYGDVSLVSVVTDTGLAPSTNQVLNIGGLNQGSNAGKLYTGTYNQVELYGNFNVLELRKAEALQRYKEVTQANKYGYDPQIKAHFGVDVPNGYGNVCTFIDGFENAISIGEEVGTSEQNLGKVGGKATGIERGNKTIEFSAKEHGILMGIYYIEPNVDYDSLMIDRFNRKLDFEDFYMPEFANIGMQPVYGYELSYPVAADAGKWKIDSILGYGVRYGEYKSRLDKVYGDFNETRKAWAIPYNLFKDDSGPVIDYRRFKINPAILNPIFAGEYGAYGASTDEDGNTIYKANASDRFLINSYWDVKAVRNMSVDGMPW